MSPQRRTILRIRPIADIVPVTSEPAQRAVDGMIRTTPFHERTSALNETQLWSHWSGHLAADRYQMSDKLEYFAVRNAAGLFDSSPLYKYRITGKDAEAFLGGILARDIRQCPPGHAQYTCWLDDRGFVIEDGVILHTAKDEYLLTSAEPNFAYFADRIGRHDVTIEEVSHDIGTLALQGPRSRDLLKRLVPQMEKIPYFGVAKGEIGGRRRDRQPDRLQRRPRLRGLDRHARRAPRLGHALGLDGRPRRAAVRPRRAVHAPHRGRPAAARGRLRLEPLRLERRPPLDPDRARLVVDVQGPQGATTARSSAARRSSARSPTRRRAGTMRGLIVDWQDYDRVYNEAGLIPPKDHAPVVEDWMLYDDDYQRVGYATSFMYSPMLQRHIAIARVRPDLAKLGTKVNLEFTVDHHYEQVAAHVARLPLYNPERKTA